MSLPRAVWFALAQRVLQVVFLFVYRYRALHVRRVPRGGGVLLVANHQSHFDPPAIGSALVRIGRSCTFLARDSLFRNPVFGLLIRTLDAHPVKRDAGDAGAMKRTIELLRAGHAVLVFPEGTRTADGTIKPFKRGVVLLFKRAGVPVVPVAIEGAFNAWPRGDRPHLIGKRITVVFGEPIEPEDLLSQGPDEALARLARDIDTLRLEGRAVMWNDTNGEYPPPSFADDPIDMREWRAGAEPSG